MEVETAANPVDDGPVTLADPFQDAGNQGPATEATAPAGEVEDTLDDLTKAALGETEATPEEEIEVEYEGEKRTLPPKWRDAFLRHQDYTRKTMDLGEQRKGFETEREGFAKLANQINQNFAQHVQLGVLTAEIQRMSQQDVSFWTQEEVAQGQAQLAQLQTQAAQLQHGLTSHHANTQKMQGETLAKQRQACLAEAAAKVPNFTDERRTELEKLAVESGADPQEVANLTDTWAYELLHFADIGKKFIERQRRAASMRTAQAGSPATMLGGVQAGTKSPEDMSMEEYASWRAAGNG